MKKLLIHYPLMITAIVVLLATACKKEEPATIPSLSTTPASNITATTAISGGVISDDGGASITANGVCWGKTENPTIEGSKTTESVSTGQFVSNLTGLDAGTTYHIRAYATNAVGTSYGADMTFLTLGQAPSGLTQQPTNVNAVSATLNATVNPNDLSTIVTFEYGLTTSYGSTATASPSPVTGNAMVNVMAEISGLLPATTYHYRVKMVNSIGTTYSEDKTFTTAGIPPAATTSAATSKTTNSATLNGTVNANNTSTTVTFEYGTTTSYGQVVSASPSPIADMTNTDVSASITGLTAGTTYHFRVKAVNSLGTTYGSDMTFTTEGLAPTATTKDATNKTSTSATLNASVNANMASTTVTFEYGTTTSYGQTVTASPSPVTGSSNTNVSAGISGLTANTTYHFRIKAVNSVGTTYGNDMSFTTLYTPPPTDGLLVYYPFNGNANDESGNNYNGTVVGASLTTDRFNQPNKAYHFTGVNRINTAFSGVLGNADRSISFWVKISEQENGGSICHYGGGYGTSFAPAINPAIGVNDIAHLDISNATVSYKASKPNDNVWHHYVYIFSTSYGTSLNGVKIYQDGILLTEIVNSYHYTLYNINSSSETSFAFGAADWEEGSYSTDDLRFYNRILTDSEIQSLYHEGGW